MKHGIEMSRLILLACTMLATGAPAAAETGLPAITAQTLIDRAQIQDMLARYMNDLGRAGIETYLTYYADDAELNLGGKSYKGRDAISSAYAAARAASGTTRSGAHAFNNTAVGVDHPFCKGLVIEVERPAFKQLHHVGTGFELRDEIIDAGGDQDIDQRGEGFGVL